MLRALTFGWFKANRCAPDSPLDAPKSFTIPGRTETQNVVVSMSMATDDFVDIEYKRLSYAEAASMAKNKKQTETRVARAASHAERLCENQYEVLFDLPDEETLPEEFKTNYFMKNKAYKIAEKTRKIKKSASKKG